MIMKYLIRLPILCMLLVLAKADASEPAMQRLAEISLSPDGIERLAISASQGYLLATVPKRQEIQIHQIDWNASRTMVIDAFPPTDATTAIPTPGRPSAIAPHPHQPLAVALTQPSDPRSRGEILFLDLRERSAGRLLRSQLAGFSPEDVAITPDGAWAVIVNSGEGNRRTEGSIGVVDLRNISGWEYDRLQEMPYRELAGLPVLIGGSLGKHEPRVVAIEPRGRIGAVSVPTADTIVWLDFRGAEPQLAGALRLPKNSAPFGLDLLDSPDGSLLLAVTEHNSQMLSLYRVSIAGAEPRADLQSRTDVRPLVREDRPRKERNPRSIKLLRAGARALAWLACGKTDRVLMLDVSNPQAPRLVDRIVLSSVPNDLFALPTVAGIRLLTANSDGILSILSIRAGTD